MDGLQEVILENSDAGCWLEIYELLRKGEITSERAMVVCKSDPYSLDVDCQKFLGREYYNRNDFNTALQWFSRAAEQGDVECQKFLGGEYYKRKDFNIALQWFSKAAEQGDVECQVFLGWKYYGRKDYSSALKWFSMASEHGNGEALFGIGSVNLSNEDLESAILCFQQASSKGFTRAAFWLGCIYYYGRGVQKNEEMALKWYVLAAEGGHVRARIMKFRIEYRQCRGFAKIFMRVKGIFYGMQAAFIFIKNPHDHRLEDFSELMK
jgi:TPR repeat protein